MVRIYDEFETPRIVAPRHLGVGDGVLVTRLPRHETGEAGPTALNQIEPLVVGEGRMTIGPLGGGDQFFDDRYVGRGHVAFDLEPGHGGRVAAADDDAP
jgi:hypothetical protein